MKKIFAITILSLLLTSCFSSKENIKIEEKTKEINTIKMESKKMQTKAGEVISNGETNISETEENFIK